MDQQPLSVDSYRLDDAIVVRAAGEVDMATVPVLEQELTAARESANAPRVVVADLREVGLLDSIGMSTLVATHQRCQQQQIDFRVVVTTRTVRRAIELVGLDGMLQLTESLDEATGRDAPAPQGRNGLDEITP